MNHLEYTELEKKDLWRNHKAYFLAHAGVLKPHAETWIEAMDRVIQIHELKLYLLEFENFKSFCKEMLGVSDTRVRQLLLSAKHAQKMESEGQPLPVGRQTVAQKLIDVNGQKPVPTERSIRRLRQVERPRILPKAVNGFGQEERGELVELLQSIAAKIARAHKQNRVDRMTCFIREAITALDNLDRIINQEADEGMRA